MAGSGAVFDEHLNLPFWLGVVLTGLCAYFTLRKGLGGIASANTLLVPLLIFLIVGIATYSLNHHGLTIETLQYTPQGSTSINWLLSALLYVGYNLVLTTAVLGPLGNSIPRTSTLVWGAISGGLILGVLISLMYLMVLVHFPAVIEYEVPMLYIVKPYFLPLQLFFTFVLWSEIFTTLIANVFGFTLRVKEKTNLPHEKLVIISLIVAGLLSGIGFSKLIGILYPLLGYIALVFLSGLVVTSLKQLTIRYQRYLKIF